MSKFFIALFIKTCLILISFPGFSQDYPDLNLYQHYSGYWNVDTIIAVKGNIDYRHKEEYDQYFERLSRNEEFIVKSVMELDSTDLKKHLFFFGTFDSYSNLEVYTPPSFSILENGFKLGPYLFIDSLDVIFLFSNDKVVFFPI